MSYEIYKIIHLIGIFMTLAGLAGVLIHVGNGGTKATNRLRKTVALTHGVGLVLALLGGFGLLARLGITANIPMWAVVKIIVWLALGAWLALSYRKPSWSNALWAGMIVLAGLAAYLAIYKPF